MKKIIVLFCVILLAGCGGGGGGEEACIYSGPDSALPFHIWASTPADNTGVPVGSAVTISFNQDVDRTTLASGITALSSAGNLPGSVSFNACTKTATFTPGSQLAPLTEYTVTVAASVRSAAGAPLSAPSTIRFTTQSAFWAYNFATNTMQLVSAQKVGEGSHCYVYVESGRTVAGATVNALIAQFDTAIYPGIVASFGSEPNPGVDGLEKIFILLMDIRDGFIAGGGYTAGYFYGLNEESAVDAAQSNQKEVFFMDINPGNPASPGFYRTLAHEFQHMVHWEQKNNRLGLDAGDNTWLDEAMSEVAPYYAGYGASYNRVDTFEEDLNRSDSLTIWGGFLKDYAVAYMWAQYMADRFPPDAFKNILANPHIGIDSINYYLTSIDPTSSFSTVFRDWSIAVFSGNALSWPGHPEWSYTTINTWPGTYDGVTLPGLITQSNRNASTLRALPEWSIDLYWYTSLSASPSLTWTTGGPPALQASFYDWDTGGALTFDMTSGTPFLYDNAAVLILQNAGGSATAVSTAVHPAILDASSTVPSPAAKLRAVSQDRASHSLSEVSGEPVPVCMQDHLGRKAREARVRIKERRNAR